MPTQTHVCRLVWRGVYKTLDGGQSWSRVTAFPGERYFRVELGIGRGAGSGVLYAGLDARVRVGGQEQLWGVIYRSSDRGQTWQKLTNAPNYCSDNAGTIT